MDLFPPLASVIIWIICYFISFYSFSYIFSPKIIPKKLREKTTHKTIMFLLVGSTFFSPIIAGLLYRLGGILEKGNYAPWGARIEYFSYITLVLFLLSFLFLFLLLIIVLIKPKIFGFEGRLEAISLYIFHHIYIFILIGVIRFFIPLIAGTLSRMNSTTGGID